MTTRRQFLAPLAVIPVAGWAVWASGAQEPPHPVGPFHLPLDETTALWRDLAQTRFVGPASEPAFPELVLALDGRTVTLRGFLAPLSEGAVHSRFILCANPVSCSACQSPQPATMVQVQSREAVAAHREPVVVTGILRLKPFEGLFYRLDRADIALG
ncbi:hypothetical protein HL658_20470 [Azospirillum sp. RWY-5-1]|uniref:DUF3299 domain-containing protein n=2 Tax=Azospirillum oleiclasticum TaxID=2735135 RepID=A0ABX2TG08_9PROT|nr:hypothetical protein [Azospirillum oleiclasticum]NYZ14928.1 hypothetical protein [Azospirillum oleiclasticum]NYZ22690.1 hypothetical protein [Azospirillum oleiclasticum]